MPPLILVALGALWAAVMVFGSLYQIYLRQHIRRSLVERHPQAWLELSHRTWLSLDFALAWFIARRADRQLNDPELSSDIRRSWAVYAASVAVFVGPISITLVAAAGSQAFGSTPESTATAGAEAAFRAKLDTAEWGVEHRDPAAIDASLEGVSSLSLYRDLTPKTKHRIDQLLGRAAFMQSHWKQAHQIFARTSTSADADSSDWYWRLESAKLDTDFADAFVAFNQVRVRNPEFAWSTADETIANLDRGFGTLSDGGAARLRFETDLADWHWRPHDGYYTPDFIWLHYAIEQLTRGQTQKAQSVLPGLDGIDVQAELQSDKRFDGLLAGRFSPATVRRAAEADLNRQIGQERTSAATPYGLAALAAAYLRLGQYDDAVSSADRALNLGAALKASGAEGTWRGNSLAHVVEIDSLIRLGRYDEALQHAKYPAHEDWHSSDQTLLLGSVLVGLGRGSDALDALKPLGDGEQLRVDGQLNLAALKACAARQAGDDATANAMLMFVREHPFYAANDTLRAYACVGAYDEAVSYVVSLLGDAHHRHLVLQSLQEIAPLSHPMLDEAALERLRIQLRHDPRVLAALAPVGRINHFDIAYLFPVE